MNAKRLGAYLVLGLLAVAVPLVANGCAGGDASSTPTAAPKPPVCPQSERVSWQKLANEIQALVYCPSWFPRPLGGRFGGRFFNGRSVDPDRSYLVSWAWFETGEGLIQEVHVNLRGYPGTVRIPTCEDTLTVKGKTVRKKIPCFSDSKGRKRLGGKDGHRLHGQPGRRHVARSLRMATWRLPLHDLRACRASVHIRAGHRPPRSDDTGARTAAAPDLACG